MPSKIIAWTNAQLDQVWEYLESKSSCQYSPDDWVMLVDWMVQRYMPEKIVGDTEYLKVRSALLEKIKSTPEGQQQDAADVSEQFEKWANNLLDAERKKWLAEDRKAARQCFARRRRSWFFWLHWDRQRK